MLKLDCIIGYLLVSLGQDIAWLGFNFSVEDLDFIRLLFCEWNIAHILEDGDFLASRDEHVLEVGKELSDHYMERLILETIEGSELSFPAVGDGVAFGHDEGTELDDKVLESDVVQLCNLSLMKQLNVDISNQIAYFRLASQEGQPVVFKHPPQLDSS